MLSGVFVRWNKTNVTLCREMTTLLLSDIFLLRWKKTTKAEVVQDTGVSHWMVEAEIHGWWDWCKIISVKSVKKKNGEQEL